MKGWARDRIDIPNDQNFKVQQENKISKKGRSETLCVATKPEIGACRNAAFIL